MTNLHAAQTPLSDPGFSLAPKNSTPLEHALYETVAALFNEVELPIDTLFDPLLCPEPVLPFLAWHVNVDEWDSDWSLETKRQVVATTIATHRIKGTVGAVKQALAAVGIDAEILEWHQQNPIGTMGTFKIIASTNRNTSPDVDEPILNPQRLARLNDLVNKVKRLSQHHTIELRSTHRAQISVAAIVKPSVRVQAKGITSAVFRVKSTIMPAAIVQAHTFVKAKGTLS